MELCCINKQTETIGQMMDVKARLFTGKKVAYQTWFF